MNEDEELVFTVGLNEGNTEERANELRNTMVLLKKEKQALDKAFKAGQVELQAYDSAQEANAKAMKSAKAEYKEITKALAEKSKSAKAAANFVSILSTNMAQLTGVTKQGTSVDRESSQTVDELTRNLAQQVETLTDLERASTQSQRANQATTSSIKAQSDEVEKLKKEYSELSEETRKGDVGKAKLDQIQTLNTAIAKQSEGLNNTRKGIRDYINDITIMGVNVGDVREQFTSGASGAKAFASSIFTSRGALVALTAVPIVLMLTALYAVLTKTQGGLDFVERKTAAVVKVFQFLTDGAVNAGRVLIAAFENPKQALIELGDLIVNNVLNRFKAFSVIAQAFANRDLKGMANGFLQLGTGVEGSIDKVQKFGKGVSDAAKAGDALAKTTIEIRQAESKLAADRAKSKADIERLNKLGDDTTKSIKVRTDAYRQAYALEDAFNKRALTLQQRRIDATKADYKGREKLEEAQKAINEENAKYYELEEASLTKRTELQNSVNSAVQEAVDKSKQATEAAKQAALEQLQLAQQIADKRVQIAQLRGQDTADLEVEAIRRAGAVEVAQAGKNAKLREAIELETELRVYKLRVQKAAEAATAIAQTRVVGLETQLALAKEGSAAELKIQLDLIQARAEADREAIRQQVAVTVEARKLQAAQLAKIDADARTSTEAANKTFVDRQIDMASKAADREAELRQRALGRIQQDQAKSLLGRQSAIEADLALVRQGSIEELNLRKQLIRNRADQELNNDNLRKDERLRIANEANRQIAGLDKEFAQRQREELLAQFGQVTAIFSQLVEAQIAAQSKALEKQQKAALDNQALSADQRTAIEKDYQKKKEALEIEAAKKRKKIATIENIINTARAITAALATGLDPVSRAIGVALAVATGAAQQVTIEAQQFAAARGGVFQSDGRGAIVRGPGTGTSDSVNARLSNGEAVINAKSTEQFYPLLSWVNQMGGGRPYPGTAGIVASVAPGLLSGGVSGAAVIDYDLLAAKIGQRVGEANLKLPAPRMGVDAVTRVQNREQQLSQANDHS